MQLAVLLLTLLHASWFPVPTCAVVVSTSQQFAQALLNNSESDITLVVPASDRPSDGRLVLAPEDFNRVGPVERTGVPLVVHPGTDDGKVNLDFNGLSSAVVLDYNASAAFMGIGIMEFASPLPGNRGNYSFVPDLLAGPNLIVYPGATISLSDVILYRRTGICLNFARDLEAALASQFGAPAVVELDSTLVHLTGRHEVLLPPNITSTESSGPPVTLILENVTYVCVPDPAVSMAPNAGPAILPVVVSGSFMPDAGTIVASDSAAVAAALGNASVTTIILGKPVDGVTSLLEVCG